ncbi:MAG: hypothetical protein ACJAT2_001636 [Bacteriovoracaceae bacterium]|jgi:hypothetical protein
MKVLSFIFTFFILTAEAKIPSELPNFNNINALLFKEIKTHMFQVLSKSRLYQFDERCRVYQYEKSGQPEVELIFCLDNIFETTKITQDLSVQVNHQYAGNIKLIQEGSRPQPLSFDEFINFQIKPPKKGNKTSFFFDHSTFGLIIDRRTQQDSLKAFMQVDDFKIDIIEDGLPNNRYRSYLLSCGDCQGVTWLKVQEDDSRLSYFSGSVATEVTPAHFNQFINYFIILPFSQLGIQFKDSLIFELGWPSLH